MADRRPTATILTTIGPLPDESSPTVRWRSLAVERARTGDVDAFEALVEADLGAAFRTALAILGSEADARDACQEAFIHAWRELPRLRDPDRFEAWLGRILVNACRSALRKRGRQSIREIPIDGASGPALRSMTSALDDRLGDREALDRAFGRVRFRHGPRGARTHRSSVM